MVLDLPAADLNELSIENEGISPPETSEGYPDCIYIYTLGSALASLSVEAKSYSLNKPNLQILFPKSTLKLGNLLNLFNNLNKPIYRNYLLNKPNLQQLFLE
jgi:hypothetical protein